MEVVSDAIDPKLIALLQDIDLITFTIDVNLKDLAIAIDKLNLTRRVQHFSYNNRS